MLAGLRSRTVRHRPIIVCNERERFAEDLGARALLDRVQGKMAPESTGTWDGMKETERVSNDRMQARSSCQLSFDVRNESRGRRSRR
jgi:hypothetical protein